MGGKQKLLIMVFMDTYAYDLWMPYMRDFNEDDCGYGYLWAMKPNHERSHQRMPCCVTSKQTKLALSRKLLLMIAKSPHPQFLLFPVVQGIAFREIHGKLEFFTIKHRVFRGFLLKFPLNQSIEFVIDKDSKYLPARGEKHVDPVAPQSSKSNCSLQRTMSLHKAPSQLSW
jgi:hypothetical protein